MGLNPVSTFKDRFCEALGGASVTEFAQLVELSKQAISAYKNGKRKPKKPTIQTLSRALNVNPDWLLGFDVPKFMKYASGGSVASVVEHHAKHFPPGYEGLESICIEMNESGIERLIEFAKDIVQIPAYQKKRQNSTDDEKYA